MQNEAREICGNSLPLERAGFRRAPRLAGMTAVRSTVRQGCREMRYLGWNVRGLGLFASRLIDEMRHGGGVGFTEFQQTP